MKDKMKHFLVGAAITAVFALLFGPDLGMAAGFIAAFGKELYDSRFGGTVDLWDTVATMLGSASVGVPWHMAT